MYIAVDFDGTIVHRTSGDSRLDRFFHLIEVPDAISSLKQLERDHVLILWTVREGEMLAEAVEFLERHWPDYNPWRINAIGSKTRYDDSRKLNADLFIDDKGVGVPLVYPMKGGYPYVYWPDIMGRIRAMTFQSFTVVQK